MTDQQILALAADLFPLVIALAGYLYRLITSHLPANKRTMIEQEVSTAVNAVEQMMQGAAGADKKAKAVSMVNAVLAEFHISVPSALVDGLIEEAVGAMNQDKSVAGVTPVGFISNK